MCIAVSYKTKSHYFGRNLDLDYSYNEKVLITPRNYVFKFHCKPSLKHHFAMIGAGIVAQDYPLYFDAVNECGLCAAVLNFPEYAVYHEEKNGRDNIAPYEFIPWILSQCKTVDEANNLIKNMSMLNRQFSSRLPLTPQHFMVSDKDKSIVVEPLKDVLKIYDNPVGVLSNSPPFDFHMLNLISYLGVTPEEPHNTFSKKIQLKLYCRGMGMLGIPGDFSSASRFVKCAYTKLNSYCGESEEESVSQFFHILTSVEQQKGCVSIGDDSYETTVYSSCCNTKTGVYYYTTYNNRQITAVDMHKDDLNSNKIIAYPFITNQNILFQN